MPNYWPGYSPPAPTGGGIGGGNEANYYANHGGYQQTNPGFPSGTQPWVHPALRNQGFPPATEPWVHPALRNLPGGMGGGGLGGGTTGAEGLPLNNQRMAINQQNWDRRDGFMRMNGRNDYRHNPGDLPTMNSSLLSGNLNDYWRRPTHGRSGGGFGPNIPGWVRGF